MSGTSNQKNGNRQEAFCLQGPHWQLGTRRTCRRFNWARMGRAFQEGGHDAQRHGGLSGGGAFGKLRIRDWDCWCSDSRGWKSVKCVPVTVFWELKDCILPLDTPYSSPLRAGGSGGQWAGSLWRPRVCLYSSEPKLSCSGAGLCTVFPVGKMKSLSQVLNPTSTC